MAVKIINFLKILLLLISLFTFVTLILPVVEEIALRSKSYELRKNFKEVQIVLNEYKKQCGKYPTSEQGLKWLTTRHDCYKDGLLIIDYLKNGYDKEFVYVFDGNNFRLISLGKNSLDISSQDSF
ncbi:MAG: type II secretion system protein GspG [Pseudobdellovibrio sp.]